MTLQYFLPLSDSYEVLWNEKPCILVLLSAYISNFAFGDGSRFSFLMVSELTYELSSNEVFSFPFWNVFETFCKIIWIFTIFFKCVHNFNLGIYLGNINFYRQCLCFIQDATVLDKLVLYATQKYDIFLWKAWLLEFLKRFCCAEKEAINATTSHIHYIYTYNHTVKYDITRI